METRNIQKTGKASYCVTLPKLWIEENSLHEGDKVNLFWLGQRQLKIQPEQRKTSRSVVIMDATNLLPEQIEPEIVGYYIGGAGEIIIKGNPITIEQKNIIKSVVKNLIGMEIFDNSASTIRVVYIANIVINTPEYIINMVNMVRSMAKDLLYSIEKKNKELLADIITRDDEIDRIHLAIYRQYISMMIGIQPAHDETGSYSELSFYDRMGLRIERSADHLVNIAKILLKGNNLAKFVFSKIKRDRLMETIRLFDYCLDMLNSKTKHDAYKLKAYTKKIMDRPIWNSLIKQVTVTDILFVNSLDRVRSYLDNMAEGMVDYANARIVTGK